MHPHPASCAPYRFWQRRATGKRGSIVALIVAWLGTWPVAAAVDYERDVEPLLRTHCYECHDGGQREAGLRLDVRQTALEGGDSGQPAIVPGDAEASELMLRVTATDESVRMPPERTALTAEQVKLLRDWIHQGADWPDAKAGDASDPRAHWAFQPPERRPLPEVVRSQWPRNAVDRFVLSRLEQAGSAPSMEADRVTLIRRLYLDLIGLPPSVEEVDQFVLDNRPDAYARLVERLLRSPHYGERWGRIWLDAARYADSDGYEKDKARQVWFYRDWVVQALNDDMPYDRFVIEQLAGDLLPGATQSQHVATGFLRNSMINEEGGIHPEQFRMLAMFDRMDAIGKSILGLTIQCAQCHNHKYDPLTQKEYYELFAFLNNDHEANFAVYTPKQQQQRAEIFEQIGRIEEDLRHRHPNWAEQMAAWEASVIEDQPTWHVIRPQVDDDSTGGQKYLPQDDGSFLAQGYAPTKHSALLIVTTELPQITAVRLELMTDPNLPCNGPGRAVYGTAALTEIKMQVAPADGSAEPKEVRWSDATADLNPPEEPLDPMFDDRSGKRRVTGPVQFAIDDDGLTAWGTDAGPGRRNHPRKAVFRLAEPVSFSGGTRLLIRLQQNHGGWNSDDNQNHNLGRFRLSITDDPAAQADPLPADVRELLRLPRQERTTEQQLRIFSYWRTTRPEWADANQAIEALWDQHPQGSTQLTLAARDQERETHLLMRGEFLQPAERVEPSVPEILNDWDPDAPRDRLSFARWLVDRQSPTVARSIVNRVWQGYFGTGLVETSEDFGTRGTSPSHPELLDWLAVELMDRGWRLKELHRIIVGSAVYRQASIRRDELEGVDPHNRLLARGARFRVDAEVVRDIALSASGLLNPVLGGSSVHPPLPEFMVKPPVSYGPKPWPEDRGADRYRRALYTFRFRSVPYPALEVFDAPNGDTSCVRRSRSNTPLQALTTWNEDIFVESANGLADRMMAEGGATVEGRVRRGFRRCVSRQPTSSELTELIRLYEEQVEYLSRAVERGDLTLQVATKLPGANAATSPVELAAWTTVARVLLNLDETITRE